MNQEAHIAIVGGGASGVLLACHLLRRFAGTVRVALIEKNPEIGRGIAYGTVNPAHLLNVRAANMSAFADDPFHFWRWLQANQLVATTSDQFCFVSRQIYGRYMAGLLREFSGGNSQLLQIVQRECTAIIPAASGVSLALADGSHISASLVVLATGNETCPTRLADPLHVSPWQDTAEANIPRDGHVLILGSGLTTVDCLQSLLLGGHKGPITALSRHGLLPRAHRPVVPFAIARADVPFGSDIAELLRWFRNQIRQARQQGGDWRSAVDGIRPYTQELWQRLAPPARKRFLRHARSWWDVHRHRMAPEVEEFLDRAISSGQFNLVAGKFQSLKACDGAARVTFRPRGQSAMHTLEVSRIMDCTGINPIPHSTGNTVLRGLLDNGLARIDPLGIGLDFTSECALVDASGTASRRIFAVGPLTRAAFWEIVAIPDIRTQCHQLTEHIRRHFDFASGPETFPQPAF